MDLASNTTVQAGVGRQKNRSLRLAQSIGFSELLRNEISDGAWMGRHCFIVGGGPSIKRQIEEGKFSWSRLEGELSIGINRAFEEFDPTIIHVHDPRFVKWAMSDDFGVAAATKIKNYTLGLKCLNAGNIEKCKEWQTSLVNGLCGISNGGLGAINLAAILGVHTIYLLGYDMNISGDGSDKQQHWHDGYRRDRQRERIYEKFRTKIKEIAIPGLREMGTRVINLNPDSALDCFEFGDFPAPVRMPVVVSFSTKDTPYEDEILGLIRSLRPWGMRRNLPVVPDGGSWKVNTCQKPFILRQAMTKNAPHPLLFVDADARILRYPLLFEGLDDEYDIAIRYFKERDQWLTGTLYLANNERVYSLLQEWEDACKNLNVTDQKAFHPIFLRHRNNGLRVKELPVEYCQIFDTPPLSDKPVIVHFQKSRQYRKVIDHG